MNITPVLIADEAAAIARVTKPELFVMVRTGEFPPPLNPSRHARSWRWSPVAVEQYVAGEWSARPAAEPLRSVAS